MLRLGEICAKGRKNKCLSLGQSRRESYRTAWPCFVSRAVRLLSVNKEFLGHGCLSSSTFANQISCKLCKCVICSLLFNDKTTLKKMQHSQQLPPPGSLALPWQHIFLVWVAPKGAEPLTQAELVPSQWVLDNVVSCAVQISIWEPHQSRVEPALLTRRLVKQFLSQQIPLHDHGHRCTVYFLK